MTEPGAIVVDRRPWVAVHATCGYRVAPEEPYETLASAAPREGVRYLIADQKVSEVFRSQLEPLLRDEAFGEAG